MPRIRRLFPIVFVLALSACNCDGTGPEGAEISPSLSTVEAESPVSIRGNSSSLVTVTVLDEEGEPIAGVEVELVGSRDGLDIVTQPATHSGVDGIAQGRVASTVEGETTITAVADGVEIEASVVVEFIDEQACPEGQIFCGEETGCVPLGTLEHCATCDDACEAPENAVASCNGGCSWECVDGWASCDDPEACDTQLGTLEDCTDCGDACRDDYANASAVCGEEGCDYECELGFGSCDGDYDTGCEAELVEGECPPKDCPAGEVDCGVAGCVALGSEEHCLDCFDECIAPENATPICAGAGCDFECNEGYGKCDGPDSTTCTELDAQGNCPSGCPPGEEDCGEGCIPLTGVDHCGECDNACPEPQNSSAVCLPTGCSYVCDTGFGDCDSGIEGCEQPLDDKLHCGACNAECVDPPNAVGFCEDGASGTCGFTCADGFVSCNPDPQTGCETDLSVATCCDFESFITFSSSCLTAGSEAVTVVHVEIRDISGQRVPGAQVTLDTGELVVLQEVAESTSQPGVYYAVIAAPDVPGDYSVGAIATYEGDWVCGAQVSIAPVELAVVASATLDAGGTGGCIPRGGNLRVRAIDELGDPLEGAFVMVGASANEQAFHSDYEVYLSAGLPALPNHTLTDADGYAVFQDLGGALADPSLMVTAGADGMVYASAVGFDASEAVLVLESLRPPPDRVTLTGGVQPSYVANETGQIGMALVTESLTIETLSRFDFMEMLEPDKLVDVTGAVCLAAGTQLTLPGNIHFPEQSHLGCTLRADPADWWITPLRGLPVDLPALQGEIGILEAINAGEDVPALISAMSFQRVGMRYGVSTDADQPNVAIDLSADLEETMPVQVLNAPSGELWVISVGDIDGQSGTGTLYLQGVKVDDPATSLSATLTTAKPEGAFANASHLAMALTMVAGQGASAVLDRENTDRTTPRVLSEFFSTPGAASVIGRNFTWQSVANANSPADYHVGRSVLRRVTPPPSGAWRSEEEPFWYVFSPAGVRGFALPTLPPHAPRASTQGYLTPGWGQSNRWFLGLYHMGLNPEPARLDAGEIDFSVIESDLTHMAITTRSM